MNRPKTVISLLLLSAFFLLSVAPAQAGIKDGIPVNGTFAGGTFEGVLDLERFALDRGRLVAIGVLKGTLSRGNGPKHEMGITQAAPVQAGAIVGTIVQLITIPVAATGSCAILHLDLGPLDLNLLGLTVNLNRVVLDIAAQPDTGNLLGNLLCTVARLLDSPDGTLVQTLNAILDLI
jgi:hypothetical protein